MRPTDRVRQEGDRSVSDGLDQLAAWMKVAENEHFEFKEAKNHFDFEVLVKYCCAFANERGGRMILGVTNQQPRKAVGSSAFEDLERTKLGLVERLRIRVDAHELHHPDGRVLVFEVPSRPVGMPIQYLGAYWMRSGESLVPMTPDQLQRIFAESQPDFSAATCTDARLEDLAIGAIEVFRRRWAEKARRPEIERLSTERLLSDAELLVDGQITYAALVLMGTHQALGRHLAQNEVIFEYRAADASIAYQQRKEYRQGFLLFHDELWKDINLRNDLFSYQEGMFRREIPAFNELAVREAILNAVSHRDYRMAGSTFVKQWPSRIEITSPGGFPEGVTAENILFQQSPRNRRIAEALARCGLIERSGQGADRMFEASIREGKLPPDFSRSDGHHVVLRLSGKVQDERFLLFLSRLAAEKQAIFEVEDLVILDAIHRGDPVPSGLRPRIAPLVELGAIERADRKRFVLSKRFYSLAGRPGEYTRQVGLDRDVRMELLFKHIAGGGTAGVAFDELTQVLPGTPPAGIRTLLRDLKLAGRVHVLGRTRAARWAAGPEPSPGRSDAT